MGTIHTPYSYHCPAPPQGVSGRHKIAPPWISLACLQHTNRYACTCTIRSSESVLRLMYIVFSATACQLVYTSAAKYFGYDMHCTIQGYVSFSRFLISNVCRIHFPKFILSAYRPHRPLPTACKTVSRHQKHHCYIKSWTGSNQRLSKLRANYLVAISGTNTTHKGGQKTHVEQLHMSPVQGEIAEVDHTFSGWVLGRGGCVGV